MFDYDPTRLNPCQMDALDKEVEIAMMLAPEKPKKKAAPCKRCKGKGILPHFSHILGGICFNCWGIGEELSREERIEAGEIAKKTLRVFQ